MDELDEMARELLAERIQSIRKGFAKGQPEDWKDKVKTIWNEWMPSCNPCRTQSGNGWTTI